MELLLVLAILTAMLIALRKHARQPHGATGKIAAAAVALALIRAASWYAGAYEAQQQRDEVRARVPEPVDDGGFVSSNSCRACHPAHFQSWHDTYHRTMTQVATPQAVQGDFSEVALAAEDAEYQLYRHGERFYARVAPLAAASEFSARRLSAEEAAKLPPFSGIEPSTGDGEASDVPIVMTTGSHHYQIYWMSLRNDRSLVTFPFIYLLGDRRWVPREAALMTPPKAQQATLQWNGICIRCHSTHGQPWMNMETGAAQTRVAELGIACESCHGPAAQHIRKHRQPLARYLARHHDQPDPTIVNPRRLSAEKLNQVCGQCHAVAMFPEPNWEHGHWNHYLPGGELEAGRVVLRPNRPETLTHMQQILAQDPTFFQGRFWADGMIRVGGREFNAVTESQCYRAGKQLSCLSCHSMHDSDPDDQLIRGLDTDQACLACHQPYAEKLAEHTHHKPQSAGSRCVNCHMPYTTYGLLKATRSHLIDQPSVQRSVKTGRPNACNACHIDKSLGWTQHHLAQWYGQPTVTLSAEEFELSATVLAALRGDAAQRGLAAWHLGWRDAQETTGVHWQAPYLAHLLTDPYAAVRYIAARSLRTLPGYVDFDYDYVGPQADRTAARMLARGMWDSQPKDSRLDWPRSVLVEATGRLKQETFNVLAKQRDDRPVDLQE